MALVQWGGGQVCKSYASANTEEVHPWWPDRWSIPHSRGERLAELTTNLPQPAATCKHAAENIVAW